MGGLELLIDGAGSSCIHDKYLVLGRRGFLQCRGCGGRGLLTVPGLWWAGAMGPDTHLLSSSFRFFPPGVGGCVVVHPLWAIGLPGSIGQLV